MRSRVILALPVRGEIAGLTLALLVSGAGCAANSEMADVWKDPTYKSGAAHNVLVVVLRKDPARRRMWEDAFTQDLSARGVTATASYRLFPDAAPDTQAVIAAVQKNGYDAVIANSRLTPETHTTYVPGVIRETPTTVQDYFGRYQTHWITVQDSGYTETDQVHRFQTDLWTTHDPARMIWSGRFETLEAPSSQAITVAVSKQIMPTLEKQGLVPRKQKK